MIAGMETSSGVCVIPARLSINRSVTWVRRRLTHANGTTQGFKLSPLKVSLHGWPAAGFTLSGTVSAKISFFYRYIVFFQLYTDPDLHSLKQTLYLKKKHE